MPLTPVKLALLTAYRMLVVATKEKIVTNLAGICRRFIATGRSTNLSPFVFFA